MPTIDLSSNRQHRLQSALDQLVTDREVPGLVALVSQGETTYVHAAGERQFNAHLPMARDTIFRIASLTKPIAAAAAMSLVEEGALSLDGPVDQLLPELANRRVLKQLDGPLDHTVPANRPISLRDLLTLRMGLGHIMRPCADYPIRQALNERELLLGVPFPQGPPPADEWLARVAELPLMYQPGEQFAYDLGMDVLGVLIARAAGQPLDAFLQERLFAPLGMADTAFSIPEVKLSRLSASHEGNPADGYTVNDGIESSEYRTPPDFCAAASGLLSTVDDLNAFFRMLLNHGQHGDTRVLSEASIAEMTSEQLTPDQRTANEIFFGQHSSWGLGMSVNLGHGEVWQVPGSFGWVGGRGTSAYADPENGLIGVLFTNRNMDTPEPPVAFTTFWGELYR